MAMTAHLPAPAPTVAAKTDLDALGDELTARYTSLRRFAAATGDADLDPDDLVQEAFTRVFRVARTAGRPDHLDAYLRTTVFNLVQSERRRRGRARDRAVRQPLEPEGRADAYPSDVVALLRHAAPVDRALVYLVDIEGAAIKDVAPTRGLTAPAARSRLLRARRQLLALITGDSADDAFSPEEGTR